MGQLTSALNKEEIEVLIEAMNNWEAIGNQEIYLMSLVQKQPMPDENDETYEFVKAIKEHYKKHEKDIKTTREIRQEKSILTKAKLVMIRQDLGINELFENSKATPDTKVVDEIAKNGKQGLNQIDKKRLELAEAYIKDLGVWHMYEKFLKEQEQSTGASGFYHEE